MDQVTAVLMEITGTDPACVTDIEKITRDVEEITQRQGALSEKGIRIYARQYIAAAKVHGFGIGGVQIIDWNTDYTAGETPEEVSASGQSARDEDIFVTKGTGSGDGGYAASLPEENDAPAEEAPAPEFPVAQPGEKQHTHLDFIEGTKSALGVLGGLVQVNRNGTEFQLVSIEGMSDDDDIPANRILQQAAALDKSSFDLADKALEMSRIFRVQRDVFDPGSDRENEILYHMVRRIADYDAFRSFAWTLAAWCDQKGLEPGDVDYQTLKAIAKFVRFQNNANFTANDQYCPALTSGDDRHVYFLPDELIREKGEELLALVNQDVQENGNPCGLVSLEGLRKDLEWLLPAMETIHRKLSAERDPYEPLTGDAADMLYVWCSVCGAAGEPVFSEDGPMSYAFDYPGDRFGEETEIPVVSSADRKEPEPAADRIRVFTYDQHQVAKGTGYSMEVPDGFAVQEGAEGREFIAWLPADPPDQWSSSSFIIFAGQKFQFDVVSSFATEEEFEEICRALGGQFGSQMGGLFEENRVVELNSAVFPGAAVVQYLQDYIHANALGGVPGGLQLIRLQISNVERKDREAYDQVIRDMMSHVRTDQPFELLKYPDDPEFLDAPLTESWIDRWKTLIENRLDHYANARQIGLNVVSSAFQNNPNRTMDDIPAFKQDLRKVLKRSGDRHDELLRRCETVYRQMKEKYPDSPDLARVYDELENVAEMASHLLTLNGDENNTVVYNSEYASRLGERTGEKGRRELLKQKEEDIKTAEANIQKLKDRKAEVDRKLAEAERYLEEDRKKDEVLVKQEEELRKLSADLNEIDKELKKEQSQESALNQELSSLGLFAMSAKKELRQQIDLVRQRIVQLNSSRKEIQGKMSRITENQAMTSLKMAAASSVVINRDEWTKYAEQLRDASRETEAALKEEEQVLESLRSGTPVQETVRERTPPQLPRRPDIERVDVRALKKALEDPLLPLVVRVLKKHSDPVLVTTMMQEDPALDKAGFMHVESLIDALIQAGLAEKVIMQRKKFYRLK